MRPSGTSARPWTSRSTCETSTSTIRRTESTSPSCCRLERGQETQIVVFAEGETAVRAQEVADQVLDSDDLEDLGDDDDRAKDLADETDFFVAEANLMQDIGRYLGTVLGPRGKMPTHYSRTTTSSTQSTG